jgi:hypothetical protein
VNQGIHIDKEMIDEIDEAVEFVIDAERSNEIDGNDDTHEASWHIRQGTRIFQVSGTGVGNLALNEMVMACNDWNPIAHGHVAFRSFVNHGHLGSENMETLAKLMAKV